MPFGVLPFDSFLLEFSILQLLFSLLLFCYCSFGYSALTLLHLFMKRWCISLFWYAAFTHRRVLMVWLGVSQYLLQTTTVLFVSSTRIMIFLLLHPYCGFGALLHACCCVESVLKSALVRCYMYAAVFCKLHLLLCCVATFLLLCGN